MPGSFKIYFFFTIFILLQPIFYNIAMSLKMRFHYPFNAFRNRNKTTLTTAK